VEDYISPSKEENAEIYYDHARHRCWASFWPKPGSPEAKAIEAEQDKQAAEWASDIHAFVVASPEAQRMAAKCGRDVNPLYVEAHGRCPGITPPSANRPHRA
jgi:hypothetical protein